jgi:FlaA1/EpsC-like NDP-sugar epimerase
MRRRIRSAAFPVHRHALPQLVVDGLLVALAYFLAFWLRFEGNLDGRYGHLLTDTIGWVVAITLIVLGAFGQYQRLWRFIGQRDYEAVIKGVAVATVVVVGVVALLHPLQWPTTIRVPGVKHHHFAFYKAGPDAPSACHQVSSRCSSCSPWPC